MEVLYIIDQVGQGIIKEMEELRKKHIEKVEQMRGGNAVMEIILKGGGSGTNEFSKSAAGETYVIIFYKLF